MSGHQDVTSQNYGNYIDPAGSHMVFIPKFWMRWNGNVPEISSIPATGFFLHEAFRFASKGFFRDKSHVSNVGGLPIAKLGTAPVSTSSGNNPISGLNGAIPNNYKGLITAMKLRSASHHLESVFESNALAVLSLAHSLATNNLAVCAFKDIAPHLPKGNNNNALGDSNDSQIGFTSSGNVPNCALTGSGFPFAKTTHNGQSCGVADVNGNLWRVNIGLTNVVNDDTYLILKETVNPNNLTASNLHDTTLYDPVSLAGLPNSTRFGSGVNPVFSGAIDSLSLRKSCAGIPEPAGVSSGGANSFGADGFWRNPAQVTMMPIVGGRWSYGSPAGVFARYLSNSSADSHWNVGGSACVTL